MKGPILLLASLATAACGGGSDRVDSPAAPASPVSREDSLIARLQGALGGLDAWADMPRYLRFDFRIEFNGEEFLFSENLWDRWSGRYRTRWTAAYQEGEVLGLVDVNTGQGDVWVNGEPAPEGAREELLAAAHYRATSDPYWLIAPFKFADPGTRLDDQGVEEIDAIPYRRLHLAFGSGIGLTPGDQFWLYLNPETGLLDRWAFFLESFEGEPSLEGASEWRWEDWTEFGSVVIARTRTLVRSPQFTQFRTGRIDFPVLRFLDAVDERVFTDPDWPMP